MRPATTTVDLGSDAVTRPTPATRRAMAEAAVGEDQCREDATVTRLATRFAELIGKEAALFALSGTTGNGALLLGQCNRGDEALPDDASHIFSYESVSPSALGGIPFNLRPTGRCGEPQPADTARSTRPAQPGWPRTERLCLEDAGAPVILRPGEPVEYLSSMPKARLPRLILDRLVRLIGSAVPDHARA